MEIVDVGASRSVEQDIQNAMGELTVQTGIRVSTGHWFSFGEAMPAEEMRRRATLQHRPLTPADVPSLSWLTSDCGFCVREDNAIVLGDSPVAWGHLDGKGGVAWCSEERGAAWESGVRLLMAQPRGTA